MENNDFSFNNISVNPLNSAKKNFSPIKEYSLLQPNCYINKENNSNIQSSSFYPNQLSQFATPKKNFGSLEHDSVFSPFFSSAKIDTHYNNNNLLTSIRKNSLNDSTPFKQMISPYMNSKIGDKM